jgi:hypothetical protein
LQPRRAWVAVARLGGWTSCPGLQAPPARHRLDDLAHPAWTAPETVDAPALALILDEIELRIAVELAKLDVGL